MNSAQRRAVVTRSYKESQDSCTEALKLLLKKAAARTRGGEKHARKESNNAERKASIPKDQV